MCANTSIGKHLQADAEAIAMAVTDAAHVAKGIETFDRHTELH